MAPPHRKRVSSSPSASGSTPPRRKSARLQQSAFARAARLQQSEPAMAAREQSVDASVLSVLSTEPEPSETWSALEEAAKQRIRKYKPLDRPHEEKLPQSLEACLEWLPEGSRELLARDIKGVTSDDELYHIFYNLLTRLMVPMKVRSRQSSITSSPPTKSQHPVEVVASTLDQSNTRDHNFRDMCPRRDDYRCILTGDIDTDHWETLGSPEGVWHMDVQAAHIIPFSYASWDKSSDVDHTYEIKTYRRFPPRERVNLPKDLRVKFSKSPGSEDLPLPSVTFLECHYRLAEIFHASGMAQVIEKYLWGWEDIKANAPETLSADGRTDIAHMLEVGLWAHVRG
ncbi:uncharacterized protein ACLA_006760 [Aspergillus clavatus NRRL 1]|uniref:Uncharacterized protein n=1 Tax=Aspergillus clavatus (strain ATCC 1007 / CBS 513.65 / DSM 816 / NCTC 3887 / NRRL 1 / QM 1276 / 107) TaxID=344612 RepID=A1CDJ1_ASPCL|nr:uncharacterized protein ACLA_006760 [Aspergillus clavatus NRRL 1]EAW11918.1 hypothetical protein ACLA_006760 [Aspergillus clavatus NRRL 1]